jgi:acyl-homoserine-lactone acylase
MRSFAVPVLLFLTAASPPERARWQAEASRVTITRDDWGIAHVHGLTDADAVFGMIYAQAEDDFPRIEANYLTNLGRTAEAEGETAIWQDLRARLYVSEPELKADYARSPVQMRRLMDAWADGLNYFLATHPNVHPRVITRFEPWMVMSFTEGSIGGDIEKIDLKGLERFYSSSPRFRGEGDQPKAGGGAPPSALRAATSPANAGEDEQDTEQQGSNGIAIAPKLTTGGALLLINPHTSFYFRSELQMSSDEVLDAYGAATWGQFFLYQGFNPHIGWMHTSSGVDNVDEFAEKVERRGGGYCYWYGRTCRPLQARPITLRYRASDGQFASRSFTAWMTHRGPIVRAENGRWIAFAMMDRPVEALQQSYLRTKATDLASFMRIAELKANSSNDTVFADDKGEIAYLHPQFVPRRDDRFDYTRPVDGSDPATDWHGPHAVSELPNTINPPNGWIQNTNTWPYRAAGKYSPNPALFPKYMDTLGDNYRERHALRLLEGSHGWTLEKLQAAAYDTYQPGFAALIPLLVQAYDALPRADGRRHELGGPIGVLRSWDYRWGADSVAQTLGVYWGEELIRILRPPAGEDRNRYMNRIGRDTTDGQKLQALSSAVAQLVHDFGRWQVPWGEVNRFQRISPSIAPRFSDSAPSIPVPFAPARYGSLASFEMRVPKTTRHLFGTYGNSFVAVVEFTRHGVRARAVSAGGESGNPASSHFFDQARRYASGNLRDVYFYPDQLNGHTERTYRPGE